MNRHRRALAGGLGASLMLPWRAVCAADDALPEASAFETRGMPYAAFDRLPAERIDVPGGVLRIAYVPGATFTLPRERIAQWVKRCGQAVSTYYGRFPAREARLLVFSTGSSGRPVRSGTTFAYRGAAIKLVLAEGVQAADLDRDWILVHEMTHLALPSVPRRQHWIEEGLATYVEPIARAQAGQLDLESVWGGMLQGLPNGLPRDGDRGLDNTPTWGRTYWGGALFALLADVGIRERGGNRKGLQQALRGILARGNMEQDSELEPLLGVGDAAVGVPVLAELYAQMKDQPHPVDLDALWKQLGVRLDGDRVRFDDAAPLAALRRALTTPPQS